MRTVYLAGPINGCTDAEAREWREQVKRELTGAYRCIDPMDDDFRGHEAENARTIVQRDKARIRGAETVLANVWRPSVGTPMEVQYAKGEGKTVVLIATEPVSPWYVYHASVIVPTVDAAIAHLRERAA